MTLPQSLLNNLDPLIRPAVELLNKYGFKTYESCQGGEGHVFQTATVLFTGEEFDLIRAYELCAAHNLNVITASRVYGKESLYSEVTCGKEIAHIWAKPYNQLEFLVHPETKTIFKPI